MDPVANPFAPGAGTPPPELAGRDELLATVRIAIERVRRGLPTKSILMVGLRGVGKTVLLDRMLLDARSVGVETVRIEAPEGRSLPALLAPELRGVLLRLSRHEQAKDLVERALRALAGFATALKLKYHDIEVGLDREPEAGLADNGDLEHDLQQLLETVGAAAQKAGTAVVMFIDELQYVEEDQLAALITGLHRTAQRRLPVTLVGAGLPQLRGRMGRAKSYAERLFDFPFIAALDPAAARYAIEKPVADQDVAMEAAALERIVRETHAYPYFLQEWGKHVWDVAQRSPITLADVEVASRTVTAALDESFFRVRFDRLTPTEKKYLRAMAELGPGPHRSGDVAEALGRKVSALAPTRSQLIAKGMIWSPSPRRHGVHRAIVRCVHEADHAGRRLERHVSRYIGAIDQGTTSSRFILFDERGAIVSSARKEHAQIFPQPGWVEHDPLEIWRNTQEVIGAALARENLHAGDIEAVGITNQRETTVLWDRGTGRPLAHALVWQDTRTAELVAELARAGGRDRFRAATGLPLATYFSALKLKWLLDRVPDARAKAEAGDALFGTVDSWLLWNLTGGSAGGLHVTDVTNASRTQLMNLATLDWDDELLTAFGVPRAALPRIASSSEVYGEAVIAPLRGVRLAGILGDQQSALVGQTCFEPGEAKNTYGTGCFLLMNTGERAVPSTAGLVTTVAYRFGAEPARYALEGSIAIAGALVQWLRDNLKLIATSADVEALAREVDDNGDVYVVPAFSGLFAPYWRDDARGVIAGLTRYATRGHIARAVLEAVAYQTRDVVEAMERDSKIPIKELRVDGGMVANELLMQFQSDLLGVPVVRPRVAETTALGAAYAAGLAVGVWPSRADLVRQWAVERRWRPAMAQAERERLYRSWRKAVTRSFDWVDRSS